MASNNGRAADGAPSKEAKKLASKDFKEQVLSLSEKRVVNRAFMRHAVGDFDPEHISIPRMYQMRKDPMLQMGLHYCKFPLIRAKWSIECEDPKIAAGVEYIIKQVYGSYVRTMLNMLDFGYQGAIKQFRLGEIHAKYEDENGQFHDVWDNDAIQPLVLDPPIQLFPEWTTPKLKEGEFAGINTMMGTKGNDGDDDRFVPPEWSLWSVNEFEENFHNWFGYPRTGYAYRYWWSYWFRFHMEDRHFEMDADPALAIQYPPGFSLNSDGEKVANKDMALQIGNDLRGGATIAWPSDVHIDEQGRATTSPMWSAEFLTGGENLKAFRESSEYLDVMKLRSILVPEQSLVEGKGGTSSRNVAATYNDIFNESLGQMADDLDFYWNRYIIPQIVEANWGADAPQATKMTSGFNDEDLTLTNELIKIAFQLDPNALPINFEEMIKMANLPVMSVAEQEERDRQVAEMQAEQMAQRRAQQAEAAVAAPPSGGGRNLSQAAFPESEDDKPVYLAQHGKKVNSTAPKWAHDEQRRREANIGVLTDRFKRTVESLLRFELDEVAKFVEMELPKVKPDSGKLSLAFTDRRRVRKVKEFVSGIMGWLRGRTREAGYDDAMQAEQASMFHASASSELARLGYTGKDIEQFQVTRQDIQKWAKDRTDYLFEGTNEYEGLVDGFVQVKIRPWLEEKLKEKSYDFNEEEAFALADELRSHFDDYPRWMAERVARTEARHTYNNAGFMIWDQAGIKKLKAFDGLGGRTGKTDAECLARNGKIYTIAEAWVEDAKEHPNGTLGFVPVIEDETYIIPIDKWNDMVLDMTGVQSNQTYVVDSEGRILSDLEVGELLASQ